MTTMAGAGAMTTKMIEAPVAWPAIANSASVAEDGSGGGEQDPDDDDTEVDTPIDPDTGPNLVRPQSCSTAVFVAPDLAPTVA
jgi:hypothetical protein